MVYIILNFNRSVDNALSWPKTVDFGAPKRIIHALREHRSTENQRFSAKIVELSADPRKKTSSRHIILPNQDVQDYHGLKIASNSCTGCL